MVGSNPTVGMIFFILLFSLSSRASQLDSANKNEINRDVNLASTLF